MWDNLEIASDFQLFLTIFLPHITHFSFERHLLSDVKVISSVDNVKGSVMCLHPEPVFQPF